MLKTSREKAGYFLFNAIAATGILLASWLLYVLTWAISPQQPGGM